MTALLYAILAVAFLLFVVRVLRGPSLADRVIGIDGLMWTAVAALVIRATRSGDTSALPAVVVLTLVAFIGTGITSRFIEGNRS